MDRLPKLTSKDGQGESAKKLICRQNGSIQNELLGIENSCAILPALRARREAILPWPPKNQRTTLSFFAGRNTLETVPYIRLAISTYCRCTMSIHSRLKLLAILRIALASIWIASGGVSATPIIGDPVLGADDPILGSKHDFTGLNARAGVVAMAGVAFSDYGYSCVYCHIPPEEAGAVPEQLGGIKDWNRFVPATENYRLYTSPTLDNETKTPSPISLLCLSCHDGTMGIDMVIFKPVTFDPVNDKAMHMRINPDDNIESCGKCHNGQVAHDISVKMLGTDLMNDHPISMRYAGLGIADPDFRPIDNPNGFDNGVKLYDGNVECATCHNVHNPKNELFLRAKAEVLCFTCHVK